MRPLFMLPEIRRFRFKSSHLWDFQRFGGLVDPFRVPVKLGILQLRLWPLLQKSETADPGSAGAVLRAGGKGFRAAMSKAVRGPMLGT